MKVLFVLFAAMSFWPAALWPAGSDSVGGPPVFKGAPAGANADQRQALFKRHRVNFKQGKLFVGGKPYPLGLAMEYLMFSGSRAAAESVLKMEKARVWYWVLGGLGLVAGFYGKVMYIDCCSGKLPPEGERKFIVLEYLYGGVLTGALVGGLISWPALVAKNRHAQKAEEIFDRHLKSRLRLAYDPRSSSTRLALAWHF